MIEEMKAIIAKNLPEQTAGELKKFMEEHELLKSRYDDQSRQLKSRMDELAELIKKHNEVTTKLSKLESMEQELKNGTAKLDHKITQFTIEKLEHELACNKAAHQEVMELSRIFFKSARPTDFSLNESITRTFNKQYDPLTGQPTGDFVNDGEFKTTTVEEVNS